MNSLKDTITEILSVTIPHHNDTGAGIPESWAFAIRVMETAPDLLDSLQKVISALIQSDPSVQYRLLHGYFREMVCIKAKALGESYGIPDIASCASLYGVPDRLDRMAEIAYRDGYHQGYARGMDRKPDTVDRDWLASGTLKEIIPTKHGEA